MKLKQHIVLIGPMGAGKSTIGRFLSEQMSCQFTDIDKVIEQQAGASIPWIFEIEGEQKFRERETTALRHVIADQPSVIATGGGCVMSAENQHILNSQAVTIYLVTSIEQQLERTAKDKNRPLLQTDDPKKVLEELANKRNPVYESLADISVTTNSKPPKVVAQEILTRLQSRYDENPSR
ncbi:shikimate kinase AroK [Reinekea thalattae]|uniref:Shikimate kinase n=1 Tax=Reinekea thalattae TaxID=2593301 RepID=A0A5C8Z4K7_9GAMM|nr:shikimate kinase AroK [Reinekea thalattae]TXR51870.1 shikimate kinase AroK [Reinekea thalattae]